MKKNLCRTSYALLYTGLLSIILLSVSFGSIAADENVSVITANGKNNKDIFVAVDTRVDNVFDALSVKLGKPIISSAEVKKRKVTGDFNMSEPEKILNQLTANMALNWFNDGNSLYIFANTELKNEIIQLRFAPYQELRSYLKATGLYDERYPTRSKPNSGSFYVAGPPIYVELIKAAAKYLDETYMQEEEYGVQDIRVIRLKNTFVNDRSYAMRGDLISVAGVASAINSLINGKKDTQVRVSANAGAQALKDNSEGANLEVPYAGAAPSTGGRRVVDTGDLSIVAYRDTNSLLVKGSGSQVRYIEQLINTLDVAKQQIELSVWVIDIAKSQFAELGVRWQANFTTGNAAIRFNSSELDVINGAKFLANVSALSSKGDAQVISRPIILTQENVPAVFDNNTTFYARLIGEKNSSLEDITYGTLVSVLPRVSFKGKEIEMVINIEDGSLKYAGARREEVDNLPMVGRTTISTVARVPRDSSLLIGGYTRERNEHKELKIPLLGDIPLVGALFRYKLDDRQQMVRIFLIQPKLLNSGAEWDGSEIQQDPMLSSNMKLRQTVSMLQSYVGK